MLLTDEQYVIKWLSQYGPLPKTQVVRLLKDKSPTTAERLLNRMKRDQRIADVGDGYYLGLDPYCTPDQRIILAVWVLLQFIDRVEPLSHYPATYPSQLFFLKENTGYEIVVLYEGEQHLAKLLHPQEDLKYIFVVPNLQMAGQLTLPRRLACSPRWSSREKRSRKSTFSRRRKTMLPPSFQTTLLALEGKLRQLQTLERTVLQAAALEDENVAYCTASQLADACEQAVLLARALPACTGRPHVFFDIDQKSEVPTPVEVGFTREGWFSLRMPMLLPKKERGSAAYVRMLLLPALRRFFQGKLPVRITPCVLVFRHVYARDRPDRALRDHDNIETNMAADCVALYVMEDDNPAACSQYECSAKGDRERTEIYVVPQTEFPQWLLSEKSMPEEGVELLRNRP